MRASLLFLCAIAATPACASEAERATPAMTATVTPASDGTFEAVLSFDEKAPLWIFHRSAVTQDDQKDWRLDSWAIRTPGVQLRRLGNHLALVPSGAMPEEVRVRVTPFSGNLLADYTPVIAFTDGTQAVFSDHFTMRPAPSIDAVEALGASFNSLPDYAGGNPRVIFRSGGKTMRHEGTRERQVKLDTPDYVVFGSATPTITDEISTVMDPGLPDWLLEQMVVEVPGIIDLYAQKLGDHGGGRPELIVGWKGPTPNLISLGGSVMGDTIIMQVEGAQLTTPSKTAFSYMRQFIAHEAAHFWLGNAVGYGDPGDAWTSEGGADLMALRAAEAIDPDHRTASFITQAVNDCARMASDGPLKTAPERHGQQVFYACGLAFSLVAEHHARQNDGDFFSFWKELIAAEQEDKIVSVEDWLAALRRAGGSDEQIALIAAMHETGVEDTHGTLVALLGSAGYTAQVDEEGRISLS